MTIHQIDISADRRDRKVLVIRTKVSGPVRVELNRVLARRVADVITEAAKFLESPPPPVYRSTFHIEVEP